jgi:alpha-galactosidase
LKLDFLYAGALQGIRHVGMPREAAYRQGLQVIREAAGDAYVLACGAPILPSIGLCDGLRAGPDTGSYWENKVIKMFPTTWTNPSAQNALRISLERYWLKTLVHIDPDVVYFRSRHCSLTTGQKKKIQDLGQIMAFKANSDLPGWLTPADRTALHTYLETDPSVEQVDWYRFRLDGREVGFDQDSIKPVKQMSASWNPARVEQGAYLYEVIKGGLPALWDTLRR